MSRTYDVAVAGATGLVGSAMIRILEERNFPVGKLYPLASARSRGKTIEFRGESVAVEVLEEFDFSQTQIGLCSRPAARFPAEFAPKAAAAGTIVIDNTSHFRNDDDIPLVVPEVNPDRIDDYRNRGIIANPNCSTIQMVVALKPLHDAVGIERINVATYQAVSGAGATQVEQLYQDVRAVLDGQVCRNPTTIQRRSRSTAVPHIDDFLDNGYTKEEMKMVRETRKILEDDRIMVNPTTVRVPVSVGHSEAVHIETRTKVTVPEAQKLLNSAAGVIVIDGHGTG